MSKKKEKVEKETEEKTESRGVLPEEKTKEISVEKIPCEFKVIKSESKDEFEQLNQKALEDGYKLGNFAVWTNGASTEHWIYFQTLYRD